MTNADQAPPIHLDQIISRCQQCEIETLTFLEDESLNKMVCANCVSKYERQRYNLRPEPEDYEENIYRLL